MLFWSLLLFPDMEMTLKLRTEIPNTTHAMQLVSSYYRDEHPQLNDVVLLHHNNRESILLKCHY